MYNFSTVQSIDCFIFVQFFVFIFYPIMYNTFIPQIVYFLTNFKEIKLYEK